MATFPLWAAIRTVKSKIGTWTGYEAYKELDPSISRESWAEAVGSARAALANKAAELTRPLNRRPTGNEITAYPSRRATGYMQSVEVFVRDVDTGLVESRFYNTRSDTIRSRQFIVDAALSRFADIAESDPGSIAGDVIGAAYTGTFQLTPRL
jgi:hypothetical protein